MPKLLRALILAVLMLAFPWKSNAQFPIEAALSAPDTESFPQIRSFLTVRDGEGRFVSGLTVDDVTLIENGVEIPAATLVERSPGAQLVLAIDPSPAFAVRDSTGTTRYDYVIRALNAWAEGRGSSRRDSLSLFVTNGIGEALIEDYPTFQSILAAAPSDHRSAVTNLQTLATAIDIASDPTPRPGMGRAVLFITPEADFDTIPALGDMAVRALQSGVRLYVWLVTSEAFFGTNGAVELGAMAEATGGTLFAFSGTETLPDPELYFDSLRKIYALSYFSEVKSSGDFELSAAIDAAGAEAVTPATTLRLTVLPPTPFFVSPPDEIYRSLVPDTDGNLSAVRRVPAKQSIEILIEFPDGYVRELVRTTLYVNGQIADENTTPPFEQFTWDIRDIGKSDRFTLQVEAVDELGLSNISLETPVNITVQRLPDGFVPAITRNSPLVVTVVVLLVGGILIAVLLRVRGLRPAPLLGNGKRRRPARDPVFQPVEPAAQPVPPSRFTRWANRLHWPPRSTTRDEPIAFLDRLHDPRSAEAPTPNAPFPIRMPEVTLGTDPNQATFVLENASVAALHARLHCGETGEFFISDTGSISGTYINYLPTNGKTTRIEHGDLLHIGTAGFRFRLNPPPQTAPPAVLPEEPPR